MAELVPHPLPDLPPAPPSDLGALVRRVLERWDVEALTRLPDMLSDVGRVDDAAFIREMLATELFKSRFDHTSSHLLATTVWEEFLPELARIVWWDIFDWQQALGALGTALARGPITGTGGKITIDGKEVMSVNEWRMTKGMSPLPGPATSATEAFAHGISVTFTSDSPADVAFHAIESHPDFEYASTHRGDHRPQGAGSDRWVPNPYPLDEPNRFRWMRPRASKS